MTDGASLSLAVVEPHLRRFGGIRRIVELTNRLVARGHEVTIHVPEWERQECAWMPLRARVAPLRPCDDTPYDLVLFNDESQWFLLDAFPGAHRRAYYALSVGRLYGKEGSWEAARAPVDLRLANSTWTADRIEEEVGIRPHVLLGGINPEHFRPVDVPKRYPVLCVGDPRPNKGTATIVAAAASLGLPVETYAGKNLAQEAMAAEYAAAEVFVVGSAFEGFGQPGLEALACGTPLVTTDNGGCRDYAIDGETALVVPVGDVDAMAGAIQRIRSDPDLARTLRDNGLALVRERFDWDHAAERFEGLLREALASEPGQRDRIRPNLRGQAGEPRLSVVVRADDGLLPLQRCVESIRRHTDVAYELVLVDRTTTWEAAAYVAAAADQRLEAPAGDDYVDAWNAALDRVRAPSAAFLDASVRVGPGWAVGLLDALAGSSGAPRAVAVPASDGTGEPLAVVAQVAAIGGIGGAGGIGGFRTRLAGTYAAVAARGGEVLRVRDVVVEVDGERLRRADAALRILLGETVPEPSRGLLPAGRRTLAALLRGVWSALRRVVPRRVREVVFPLVRRPYYRLFPHRHPSSHRYGGVPGPAGTDPDRDRPAGPR